MRLKGIEEIAALETRIKSLSTSNLASVIYRCGTTGEPKDVVEVELFGVLRMLRHHKVESFQKDNVKEHDIQCCFLHL